HEPPAESSWRAESSLENLQAALQQFRIEIPVAGNLDAHQFVLVASLNSIGNCLLGSLPSKRLHVVHFNLVAHLGVEVALAFQPLPDVPFSFLEKVGIDGPFLVNGDQSFKFAFGELRATRSEEHTSELQSQSNL